MAKEFTIKKGHRLWSGNYPFVLLQDTKGIFETVVDSPDAMAEVLATNPALYAAHRDDLAHDEDGFENVQVQRMNPDGKTPVLGPGLVPIYDIEAKAVKIHVTYGVNGERIERKASDKDAIDPKKQTAEQKKNVAAADQVAEKEAKEVDKLKVDPNVIGTPLDTLAKLKDEEKKKAEAKGLADADSRRKMEADAHNRSGGSSTPIV